MDTDRMCKLIFSDPVWSDFRCPALGCHGYYYWLHKHIYDINPTFYREIKGLDVSVRCLYVTNGRSRNWITICCTLQGTVGCCSVDWFQPVSGIRHQPLLSPHRMRSLNYFLITYGLHSVTPRILSMISNFGCRLRMSLPPVSVKVCGELLAKVYESSKEYV